MSEVQTQLTTLVPTILLPPIPTKKFSVTMDTQPVNALSQILKNMTVQDVLTVLKDTQVQNQALRNKIRALCTAPTPIEAVSGPPSIAPVSSPVPTGSADSMLNEASGQASILKMKESKDSFEVAGRRLIVMGHVWWEKKNIFGIGQASAQQELDAALALYLQGSAMAANVEKVVKMRLVLQLYKALASQYHVFMGGTIPGSYHKLEKIMKDAGKAIRSTLLNQIKANTAKICEGIICYISDLWVIKQAKREWHVCPCLYEPGKRVGGNTLFRSPATLKILICVLWGSSVLTTKKFQTKSTYGKLWDVKEVILAAIVFAAITLCFLLSGDPSFTLERGAKSKINYFSDFEFYVSIIEKKLAKGSRSMLSTFQLYNDEVFPTFKHVRSAAPNLQANLEENSEEEEILRGLDEVEAEVYSDNADFTAFTDAIDLQANTLTVPASTVIEDIVEATPVPEAAPQVKATKGKGGRKKANTSQGSKVQSQMDQPLLVERERRHPGRQLAATLPTRSTRRGARSGTKDRAQAATIKVEIDNEEASENDDDDNNSEGFGLGGHVDEEEEEEEDLDSIPVLNLRSVITAGKMAVNYVRLLLTLISNPPCKEVARSKQGPCKVNAESLTSPPPGDDINMLDLDLPDPLENSGLEVPELFDPLNNIYGDMDLSPNIHNTTLSAQLTLTEVVPDTDTNNADDTTTREDDKDNHTATKAQPSIIEPITTKKTRVPKALEVVAPGENITEWNIAMKFWMALNLMNNQLKTREAKKIEKKDSATSKKAPRKLKK
ncbi:hypothetical protein F5146DRAFT_1006524 [Armillaria mellea]|nr:hypothetical protein F5146DRAFT_1006524 [Armillaria mellea]